MFWDVTPYSLVDLQNVEDSILHSNHCDNLKWNKAKNLIYPSKSIMLCTETQEMFG
jgi:hypothetical protein